METDAFALIKEPVVDAAGLTENSTVREAYASLTERQRRAVEYMIGQALKAPRR